jgi:SPP1 family phage portal protein
VYKPKRKYVLSVSSTPAGDSEIIDGYNYPSFPVIPLWGNPARQSELVGMREGIDAYDLIKSGFANDVDDASQIYWTIQNAGGMDDIDLAKFVERMRTVKAAVVEDDGAKAEQHSMDIPASGRETLLERIRNDLYDDFMALDTKNIAGGAITATQIKASYEPMNNKADMYEYCIHDFLDSLFYIVGIESEASFTRSTMLNVQETIQVLTQAAMYLPEEYITKKILETLGDADKVDEIMDMILHDEMERTPINGEVEEDNGQGASTDGQDVEESGRETGQGVQ